jgi:hypothetical protein
MKPRIGVYLSEQMAARLAAAAKRPGTSKSSLVEAALAQFFGADDNTNDMPVDRRLSLMSRQLEELDRGLRIVNETVAYNPLLEVRRGEWEVNFLDPRHIVALE